MITFDDAVTMITAKDGSIPKQRSMLVAISGIDGSGKGYLASRLNARLTQQGLRIAQINIDG